jgi:hypothetical protein
VFLLVDEGTVEKYKADMSGEIEPQITELISRAEKGMKTLQKRHHAIHTKVFQIFRIFYCLVSKKYAWCRLKQLVRDHNRAQRPVGRIASCKCS